MDPGPDAADTRDWDELLAQGEHLALCRRVVAALDAAGRPSLALLSVPERERIEAVAGRFLQVFADPGFTVPGEFTRRFVARNHLISNLVAYSSFRTTDAQLERLRPGRRDLVKIFTLWSARNTVQFDRAALFGLDPVLASLWYVQYSELFHVGLSSAAILENLRVHFQLAPPALRPTNNAQEPYFGASYVDGECERTVKAAINRSFQRALAARRVSGARRDPRKVAVVSVNWRPHHSVYRNYSRFVDALRSKYHLTFIQIAPGTVQHTAGFHEVRSLADPSALSNNDFQLILYPDVGMIGTGIALANMRLAPVQVCLLGHSVSTFGSEIDYFVSGAQVEIPDAPERNYSERLVLLPGLGIVHNRPLYRPRGGTRPADRIVVNCPWHAHKVNHGMLLTLAKLHAAVSRPVLFRLFIGGSARLCNDYTFFHEQVAAHIPPDAFELAAGLPYDDYMARMEQGHLALDAFHFGGCNTVSDALFLRMPMVCREGSRWYNRIGPAMLRQAGVPELVAGSEEEYIEQAVRLIHDDSWRESLVRRLNAADLDATIYSTSDAGHFLAAIDYLIANHEKLKATGERTPLRFPRA